MLEITKNRISAKRFNPIIIAFLTNKKLLRYVKMYLIILGLIKQTVQPQSFLIAKNIIYYLKLTSFNSTKEHKKIVISKFLD